MNGLLDQEHVNYLKKELPCTNESRHKYIVDAVLDC